MNSIINNIIFYLIRFQKAFLNWSKMVVNQNS